ncbi:MAG: aspartate--tRNA ligase [Waddliaceae bacterium]|nr:aspartate--tRNA ligase [Waddliaceae bacterium]
MVHYRRTHDCGTLRKEDIGQKVTLSGWVHRRRDHGGLIFIDLRDRYGLTQIVFDPDVNRDAHRQAEEMRSEWVLSIQGEVIPRAEGMSNPKLKTGDIEVQVLELSILSRANTPPFSISDETIQVNEDLRLKHRYLDIRRGTVAENLQLRHQVTQCTRNFLDRHGFLDIQTPILGKSTPEGARDYLVPSRVHPNSFYALPQSPQLLKQLLMISGVDRYFQIATCFRDEDLRADRQPEFTQIDIEMSFASPDDLFPLIESLIQEILSKTKNVEIPAPFPRLTYDECIERYGTDKPDLRFAMPLVRIDDIAKRSTFTVFQDQLNAGGSIKAICVKGGADISRKGIDSYTQFVGTLGIKGLAWMKLQDSGLSSSIVKFFSEDLQKELIEQTGAESGDLLFMVADTPERCNQGLDHLRRRIARDRQLIDENAYNFLWVTDFPLFAWNDDEKRIESEHHPFTSPHHEDIALIDTEPLKVRSSSYDLVLNGYETASGSQRIHDSELQKKIFETLQLSSEDIYEKFGFFVEALQYGTPPHLGVALGLDRIMMVLCKTENIRDVIAFPKNQKAVDVMTQAPSAVAEEQMKELHIKSSAPKELTWT